MQPQPTRIRAALLGVVTLALAGSLAACGGGGNAKPAAASSAAPAASSAAASPSAAKSSPAAPAPSSDKVAMPTGPQASLTKARDTANGPIMVTTLTGPKSGVSGKVWVWLPPQYNDPKYANYGFPVVTLYAGGQSNGYNTWTDNQLPIEERDAQLAQQGAAHPFIMIMPVQNLNGDESRAFDCSDIPGQPKMGTWMAQDIPDFIRANFRTLKDRNGWAVMGASTGGFCSAKLALQNPDTWGVAVPIDGYFIPDSKLWAGHDQEKLANSPNDLVTQGKADVKMLVTAGGAESYELTVVKSWVAKAKAPVSIEYYEQPGGKHLTKDFGKMIDTTLQWLTKHMPAPTA